MEIQFIEKDKQGRAVFMLKDCDKGFANTLRRTMMNSVPAMAIEDIEFRKNSSLLYDEVLAHRIGLVPLKTDLKSYELRDECKCEGKGCPRCTLDFTLKAKGPGIVYASELKSKDKAIKPLFPNMPLVKLLKGQEVELEATAILGKGSTHAKFSPGLIWYKYKPVIEIDDKKCTNAAAVAKVCPKNVFEVKGDKLFVKRPLDCHLCLACVDAATNNSVKVNPSGSEFMFYIESWGQLSAREIFSTALEILQNKLEKLGEILEEK